MQASRQQPVSAAEKLIDVVIGQPYEVYESFLEAVKQTGRMDVFEWLVNSGFEGPYRLPFFHKLNQNKTRRMTIYLKFTFSKANGKQM